VRRVAVAALLPMKSKLLGLFKPKILVPAVFAVVLIGFVLSLGNIRKVGQDIVSFPRGDAALFFLLMVIYEVVRGVQWFYFLRGMKVKVGLRRGIFAFVGGEAAKSLPAGNYFQNYLLEREKGVAVAYTASGTTITVLLEVVVAVVYLIIVGISGWAWLRPLLIIGTLGVIIAGFIIVKLDIHANPPEWLGKRKFYQWAAKQGKTFIQGAETFVTPKSMAIGLGLAVIYLAAAGTEYYIVIRALGNTSVSIWSAISAYLFGLGVGLILPVPTDIGVQEITGVGALTALGMATTKAVSVTIIYRILNLVSSLLIAIITFAILHDEFRDAFSSRQGSGKVPEGAATGE
jgi:uncharacterized membrane protein YbhN (UPF0104 family)